MEKLAKIERGAVKVEMPVSTINDNTTPKIVMPAPESTKPNAGGSPSDSWVPWVLGGGGALLAHAITSPMFEASEEDKRKESVWTKLLRTLIPLGVGGLGGVAGYALGNELTKKGQAKSTNDWDRVTGKNGRFVTIAPPQYSESLDKLLQYVDDNDDTTWNDIVRIARELKGKDYTLRRDVGDILSDVSLVPKAVGGVQALYGMKQLHDSNQKVIQNRYHKTRKKIPQNRPASPSAAPVKKWYNPFTWDIFSNNNGVRGAARTEMIDRMRRAADVRLNAETAAAPGKAVAGWKNIGKGSGWLGLGLGVDYAADRLAETAENGEQAALAAKVFMDIRNKLEKDMMKARVLPENISTNAPVATAQDTVK